MSLRIRLVLVATAAVAAAVVLASVIVYFVVRNELYGPINSGLATAAGQVRFPRGFQLPAPTGKVGTYVITGPGFGPDQAFSLPFRFVASNGSAYSPLQSPLRTLKVSKREKLVAGGSHAFFFDTKVGGQSARIYAVALSSQPGYAIEVAASIGEANHALRKIELWLVIVALGGIGIAAGSGFLVARAALIPVRRLSDAAEDVRTTRDLTRRIAVTGNDELSHLATTFNAMLESLDAAAQQQRQLVQDASHELRTPLTSLRTNIEMLASKHEIPADERAHMLSDVVAQLTEMTALIGELTELAQGEEQRPVFEEVRLDLIAEDAIRRTTRNHPDVAIDSELTPTTVVGTPASLERALANLLDNAAKWSPAGGRIDVRLADGELTVRDHGPGIAADDLPFIFDRFYRATSARSMPGSGLGLAIVKQVAEAHGGTITAEPAPDEGTIMRFTFRAGSEATSV
ncbi:MAG TPA: HAMP domain-containing sensor histidine kinase [Gaiellaceae bacterium]|nr:HAMP domain-containing sensor histidine kinase [Gaiellaceae bacterium]